MIFTLKTTIRAMAFALATLCAAQPGSAITINVFERTAGQAFDLNGIPLGVTATVAPSYQGAGTLAGVMQAAASYWSAIIKDEGTLNIQFGWSALLGNTLATATQFLVPGSFSGSGRSGAIRFDSDESFAFFLDDDPSTTETFAALEEETADLGGGEMSVGLRYRPLPVPGPRTFDLFTVAIHEIGHLLGFADLEAPGYPDFNGPKLNITTGPFVGAVIDLTGQGGGHLPADMFPNALMQPFIDGSRRLASDADIAVIAELSAFENVDYQANRLTGAADTPATVPLPASGLLLIFGLGGLALFARRKSDRTAQN